MGSGAKPRQLKPELFVHCFRKRKNAEREQQPKQGIEGADLTENIKRNPAVVPDIHFEHQIEDDPENEFNRRHTERTYRRFEDGGALFELFGNERKDNKTDTARDNHCPMRSAAPYYFDYCVTRSARSEKDRNSFHLFQKNITRVSFSSADDNYSAYCVFDVFANLALICAERDRQLAEKQVFGFFQKALVDRRELFSFACVKFFLFVDRSYKP